jgi:hypothetical protein
MDNDTIEIPKDTFWQMYNALREAEGVLWECEGSTNPENDELTESIVEANQQIESVLNDLQKIVCQLKEKQVEQV